MLILLACHVLPQSCSQNSVYENSIYFNGLLFALYAFYFAILMVLPIITAAEGGGQLTTETAAGTLQLLLARPILRSRIFAIKLRWRCI